MGIKYLNFPNLCRILNSIARRSWNRTKWNSRFDICESYIWPILDWQDEIICSSPTAAKDRLAACVTDRMSRGQGSLLVEYCSRQRFFVCSDRGKGDIEMPQVIESAAAHAHKKEEVTSKLFNSFLNVMLAAFIGAIYGRSMIIFDAIVSQS